MIIFFLNLSHMARYVETDFFKNYLIKGFKNKFLLSPQSCNWALLCQHFPPFTSKKLDPAANKFSDRPRENIMIEK